MSQPPGAPPEDWERRKDRVTRKLIEDMDGIKQMVASFDEHLEAKTKSFVSWQGLAGSVVALVGLIFLVVGALMTPVKESAAQTRIEMKEARKDLADEVKDLKQDVSRKVEKIDARVEAVYRVTVEGKPRGPVKEEANRRTEE